MTHRKSALAVLAILALAMACMAVSYVPYWIVNGDLTVQNGGDININGGGNFRSDSETVDFEFSPVPAVAGAGSIGTTLAPWGSGHFGDVNGSGDVVFTATYVGSGTPPVTGAGYRLMWWEDMCSLRAGGTTGDAWDTQGMFSVGLGLDSAATGNYSTVLGGSECTGSGEGSVVGGGIQNTASGARAFVGGGTGNTASGNYTANPGGKSNEASGDTSFVGGGDGNTASGDDGVGSQGSTVVAGHNNISSGRGSFVGAGSDNTAAGQFTVVPGGKDNSADASAQYSSVLGGQNCATGADGDWGAALGGQQVTVNGDTSLGFGRWLNITGDRVFAILHDSATPATTVSQDDSVVFYNADNGGYSVGINTLTPLSGAPGLDVTGKFNVSTPATVADAAVTLDQNDVDQAFIEFQGTANGNGTGNLENVSGSVGTASVLVRVTYDNGGSSGTGWMVIYTNPSFPACPRIDAWLDGEWVEVGRAIRDCCGAAAEGQCDIILSTPAQRFRLVEDEPEVSFVRWVRGDGEDWGQGSVVTSPAAPGLLGETTPEMFVLEFEFSGPVNVLETFGYYERASQ